MLEKQEKRYRRHKRVRAKIKGVAKVPRLCVFRSSKHIYAQLIDDEKGNILASANDLELRQGAKNKKKKPASAKASADKKEKVRTGKLAIAFEVGKLIAEKVFKKTITRPKLAPAKGGPLIEKVKFDRGGYKYHGRVKALAEGAREGGLKF